jgi:lipoate-protein ligase A
LGIKAGMESEKERGERRERRYCYSYPSRGEITVRGKKIAGLAQKKGRCAVLQQGAIFVNGVDEMTKALKRPIGAGELSLKAASLAELTGQAVGLDGFARALAAAFGAR